MKLVLLSLHVEKSPTAFPLAAAILKTGICSNESSASSETEILEMYLPVDPKKAAGEVLSHEPDALGCTICTWNASEIIGIASEIKKLNPGIIIIAGGSQASADPGSLAATGYFNFIVRGEGETVLPELLSRLEDGASPASAVIEAPAADFAGSPSPYKTVLRNKSYQGILWELSRGCPYSCSFCYESRGERTIRTIPEKRMAAELRYFRKNGINKIWVLDPTFNHSSNHAAAVLQTIAGIHPEAEYTFEIRAELITREQCEALSGIRASLQVGLQSTNPEALRHLNRKLNREKFTRGCRMMAEYGLSFGVDLIYGLPGDDYEGFCNSLDFAVGLSPNNIDIFPLSVLPGTPLADSAEELGILHGGFPRYEVESTETFCSGDITRAESLTTACDSLYNREQSFAWFKRAAESLSLRPSELFELWAASKGRDAAGFISRELKARNCMDVLPVIESLISWSRTAEQSLKNPGKEFRVKLCRKPEILDQLTDTPVGIFMKRHPAGRMKSYRIFFDGEELYID